MQLLRLVRHLPGPYRWPTGFLAAALLLAMVTPAWADDWSGLAYYALAIMAIMTLAGLMVLAVSLCLAILLCRRLVRRFRQPWWWASLPLWLMVFATPPVLGVVYWQELAAAYAQVVAHVGDPNATNQQGATRLHRGVLAGQPGAVRVLLARGAAVTAQDTNGNTPLHLVAGLNDPIVQRKLVVLLLQAKADPRLVNAFGETPLHPAVSRDSVPLVMALLVAGAPVSARDARGSTPLMRCAERGYGSPASKAIMAALLTAGAQVSETDQEGNTALHLAARANQAQAVAFLLTHGAHPNAANLAGQHPLDLASDWNQDLVRQLSDAGAQRSGSPALKPAPTP